MLSISVAWKGIINSVKQILWALLCRIPSFKRMHQAYHSCPWPPGHFYSTIPSLREIEKHKDKLYHNRPIRDVSLDHDKQFKFVKRLQPYYKTVPFDFKSIQKGSLRYCAKDAFYRYSDAVFLYCMIRHFAPRRIIEVGSGHSSAIMLDTNELYFKNQIKLDFIEPYPEERLTRVMREDDRHCCTIHRSCVQDVGPEFFSTLERNDILFIDSTHVSKVGSDVNYLFFDVFPVLKPGTLIHIHDIFYPFELPERWTFEHKFFWNENYLLRAFLMNNHDYQVVLFNSMVQNDHKQWFAENMPICLGGGHFTSVNRAGIC